MKKLLLAGLLIVFTGITFAEMPRIVNPPRPTRKFKWLIVIKHRLYHDADVTETHTYFIYANNYLVKEITYGDGGAAESSREWQVVTEGESEEIIFDGSEFTFVRPLGGRFVLSSLLVGSPPNPALDSFYVAKAPNPVTKPSVARDHSVKFLLPSSQPAPQKAKVVFTK